MGNDITRDDLRRVTVQFTVPVSWDDHFKDKVVRFIEREGYSLGRVEYHIGTLSDGHWDQAQKKIALDREQFTVGEWVTIRSNDTSESLVPDFVKGTVGQIQGFRQGFAGAWKVGIPTPAMEVNGTEWLYDEDLDRRFLVFYYQGYDLTPITDLAQIPLEFRDQATLRPPQTHPLPSWTPEQYAELRQGINDFCRLCEEEENILTPAPILDTAESRAHARQEKQSAVVGS